MDLMFNLLIHLVFFLRRHIPQDISKYPVKNMFALFCFCYCRFVLVITLVLSSGWQEMMMHGAATFVRTAKEP